MSEERFWNTDEYVSTAKFAIQDGVMTMRQAGRIFRLAPAPPKVEMLHDALLKESKNKTRIWRNHYVLQCKREKTDST